jgi:S-(hydroxymethyl)glutathione dehydrogenase / alcohol dehydrogenase
LFQGLGLGGFAERVLVHENQLALLPKDMPFAQAASAAALSPAQAPS